MKKKPAKHTERAAAKTANRLDISATEGAKIEAKRAGNSEQEFDPSVPLDNQQHEVFAQLMADGKSGTSAYQAAFNCEADSARANAVRLIANDSVGARLQFLRTEAAAACKLTREELIALLVRTLQSAPDDASMDSTLCELKMSKVGPFAGFMDKGRSAERLCKMLGWDAPDKVEHSGTVQVVLTEERREQLIARRRAAVAGVN